MRYIYRKHPSKLATLMVTFGAGSRVEFESKYPSGIAHFMEHVRFKGTKSYTAKDLLDITARSGGSWNAWTSEDLVSYHMTIPEENIETAFKCLSEIIIRPSFPKEELKKEQEVVCQEVRMYDDDIDSLVQQKMFASIFENSLAIPIIGTEESVRQITRKNIVDFNKEFYSKEHMLITLAAPNDHEHLVEKYFGIPDNTLLFPPKSKKIKYKKPKYQEVVKPEQLQNVISVGFAGSALRKATLKKRAAVKVFNTIFGGGDTSRLFLRVREDLGLVYGIGSYVVDGMDGSMMDIYTSTEPENTETVIGAINEEIEKMKADPPKNEDMERANNIILSSYYGSLDTSLSAANKTLVEEFFGQPAGSEFLAQIREVTPKEVQEVANDVFNCSQYLVVGTGKIAG